MGLQPKSEHPVTANLSQDTDFCESRDANSTAVERFPARSTRYILSVNALPKVGWLLRVLVLIAVGLCLAQAWRVWDLATSGAITEFGYVGLAVLSLLAMFPSLAAWLLLRWKSKWVRFVRIRVALGDEYSKPRLKLFGFGMGIVTAVGATALCASILAIAPYGFALAGSETSVGLKRLVSSALLSPVGIGVWILMIAASRFLVQSARVEALRSEHFDHTRKLIDKCETFCQQSSNPDTREARAELGLKALPVLRALNPRSSKRAAGLELYFTAIKRCAQLAEAVQRSDAVQTKHARQHHAARALDLLEGSEITDEDLVLIELDDPQSPGNTLTIEALKAHFADVLVPDAPIQEPTAPETTSVQPEEPGVVQGYRLKEALLYVGEELTSVSSDETPEPALINPNLKVDPTSPARSGRGMAERPSYTDLTPKQRAAFLEWLSENRTATKVHIGYLLLFFYGLERRLGFDLPLNSETTDEWLAVRGEVARLGELHEANNAFTKHTASFLAWIDLQLAASGHSVDAAVERRVVIGELARAGKPVSGKVAFEWARASSQFQWKASAQRCPDEFRDLFFLRYQEQHGAGLTPSSDSPNLAGKHKTASPSFAKPLTFELDLPDAEQDEQFVSRITELLTRCNEELAPYVRRNQAGEKLTALSLLPRELAITRGGQAARDLVRECETALERSPEAHLEAATLRGFFAPSKSLRWTKAEAIRMALTLDRFGFGIEPDPRFAAPTPRDETTFELFRLPDDAPLAPSEEYLSATALVQLTAAVVAADGELLSAEETQFEARLEETLSLGDAERLRLRAHLRWRARERPSLAGLKARASKLSSAQRRETARFLLTVAGADGQISTPELAVLCEAYALLGLDEKQVHSDIHSLALREEGAGDAESQVGKVQLDPAVLDRKRRETLAVSRVLADIFEEEPETQESQADVAPAADVVPGLDESHSALFHAMRAQESWTRTEFEALSSSLGLLPDGALETLNETAYERCDSPFTEGDDPIEVIHETVQEFLK